MIRIPGNSPATKAAVVIVAAVPILAIWTAIAVLIALVGLDQVTTHTNWHVLPEWLWYYRYSPELHAWLLKGYFLGSLVVGLGVVLMLWDGSGKSLHGEARFANEREIEEGGLRNKNGILLAKLGSTFLTAGVESHVLLEAPTGSGKGVGIVIPNLLNWAGSVVCLDMKQENYLKTAGFRKQHGQEVHLFDPVNPDGATARYNPIGYIDRNNPVQVIDELQKIATMLFPLPEKGEPFWAEAARTAFVGVGAWLAATPALPFTVGEIYRSINSGDPKVRFLAEIRDREAAGTPLSGPCVTALSDFTSASDNTFSGIKQTVTTKLALWLNPHVDRATSASDFDLRELRMKPISIYLGASPNNIDRVAPLYNLIFQQLVDLNTDPALGEFDPRNQHRVLVLLDEFAKLGRAPVIVSAISFVRSFGLNLLIVVQNKGQLKDGADEISANSDVSVVYTPKEYKDAKDISDRLGTHGLGAKSKSRALGWFGRANRSVSESEHARALMLPQEVLQMPLSDVLIFKRGIPPVKAAKLLYYKMAEFTSRLLPAPKVSIIEDDGAPVNWVDRAPMPAGSIAAAPSAEPEPAAPTRELTDAEIDGEDEIPADALVLGDADPLKAIQRGEEPVAAVSNWLAATLGVSAGPDRAAA